MESTTKIHTKKLYVAQVESQFPGLNKYEECCNEKKLNVPLNPSNQVQYRQLGMRLNVSRKSEITKVKSSKFYRLILQ